jgi:hypothetical protein
MLDPGFMFCRLNNSHALIKLLKFNFFFDKEWDAYQNGQTGP